MSGAKTPCVLADWIAPSYFIDMGIKHENLDRFLCFFYFYEISFFEKISLFFV